MCLQAFAQREHFKVEGQRSADSTSNIEDAAEFMPIVECAKVLADIGPSHLKVSAAQGLSQFAPRGWRRGETERGMGAELQAESATDAKQEMPHLLEAEHCGMGAHRKEMLEVWYRVRI